MNKNWWKNKGILTLILSFFLLIVIYANLSYFGFITYPINCDYTVSTSANKITIDGNNAAYSSLGPGKVVCFNAGTYTKQIEIVNVHGQEGNPVIFINKDGQARIVSSVTTNSDSNRGLFILDSSYVRFTGTGSSDYYGFYFDKWYHSIEIGRAFGGYRTSTKSTDIELDHVEMANPGYSGIMGKTDPIVGSGLTCIGIYRSNFVMKNIKVHDNYIHNAGGEGMYFGFTHFEKSYTCSGKQEQAHLMDGTWIYNNLVTDTGIDGIQIGGVTGDCRVFNNTVLRDDTKNDGYYGKSGIQINPGYNCDVYNNFVKDGNGEGIRLFTEEGNIYNNIIINQKGGGGIWFKNTDSLNSASDVVNVMNNVIINSGSIVGIGVDNKYATGKIQNNIIVRSDTNYIGKEYIAADLKKYEISNNIQTADINSVKFVNNANDDYSLLSDSPAIDKGIDSSFNFDFYTNSRVSPYDIGAIEYNSVSNPKLSPEPTPVIIPEPAIIVDNSTGNVTDNSTPVLEPPVADNGTGGSVIDNSTIIIPAPVTPFVKINFTQSYEAENFVLTGSMISYNDKGAFSGKYITSSSNSNGKAVLIFNVPQDGQYVVWGRILSDNDSSNSFHASMDSDTIDNDAIDGISTIWDTPIEFKWVWDKVSMRPSTALDSSQDLIYDLTSGSHTLYLNARESNTQLDKVIITNVLEFIPVETIIVPIEIPVVIPAPVITSNVTNETLPVVPASNTTNLTDNPVIGGKVGTNETNTTDKIKDNNPDKLNITETANVTEINVSSDKSKDKEVLVPVSSGGSGGGGGGGGSSGGSSSVKDKLNTAIQKLAYDPEANAKTINIRDVPVITALPVEGKVKEGITESNVKLSNGREVELKVKIDKVHDVMAARIEINYCNETNECDIRLREITVNNETKLVYQMKAKKDMYLFGILKIKMDIIAETNAETEGEIIIIKPWWAFLVF